MGAIAFQITSLTIVYSTVYSGADQSKHQSSASLAFVWGIHRRPVNSPHKWPVTRKMFPFDDVIMVLTAQMSWHVKTCDSTGMCETITTVMVCVKLWSVSLSTRRTCTWMGFNAKNRIFYSYAIHAVNRATGVILTPFVNFPTRHFLLWKHVLVHWFTFIFDRCSAAVTPVQYERDMT